MLEWRLQHGTRRQVELYEKLESLGRRTPLRDLPECPEWLQPLWNAFQLLSSTRSVGMGPNPISVSDFRSYADMVGWNSEMCEFALPIILGLDRVLLKFYDVNDARKNDKNRD